MVVSAVLGDGWGAGYMQGLCVVPYVLPLSGSFQLLLSVQSFLYIRNEKTA